MALSRPSWLVEIVLAALVGACAVGLAWSYVEARAPEPGALSPSGTIERRMHLTVDTRYDTDKRRKFTCKEER